MQELSRVEHDPFFIQVLEEIKAGKYVLKKPTGIWRTRNLN